VSAGIHFISAGAGSGKTFRLTAELRDRLARGRVEPAGVIATTFTRLAASELQERVRRALIEAGEHGTALRMEQALIGTVNGVCGELLRRFAFEAGIPPEQQVIDEVQGKVLFYQAMELALAGDRPRLRKMNALSHRLADRRPAQSPAAVAAGSEEDRRRGSRQQPVRRRHPRSRQRQCGSAA
jgi:ATP-dependent helicase/nuclease subunit A